MGTVERRGDQTRLAEASESAAMVATKKRYFIVKQGGVKFGGTMTLTLLAHGLSTNWNHYFPLWPPTGQVVFSWAWGLIVTPLFSFGLGCLFGLVMWKLFGGVFRRSAANSAEPR
jgi:hypothetical protein